MGPPLAIVGHRMVVGIGEELRHRTAIVERQVVQQERPGMGHPRLGQQEGEVGQRQLEWQQEQRWRQQLRPQRQQKELPFVVRPSFLLPFQVPVSIPFPSQEFHRHCLLVLFGGTMDCCVNLLDVLKKSFVVLKTHPI